MRIRQAAVLAAVVVLCGCQRDGADSPSGPEIAAPGAALLNRAWARSDSTGLPGVIRIFLSNGTLVMDSCWETYQLATWRSVSDSVVTWQEGSAEVRAEILEVDQEMLVLRVDLASGSHEERYRAAPVPYLCPDMVR